MTTNKNDANDTANWPPHTETTYVILLHEEVKMGNLQTSTIRKKKQWLEYGLKILQNSKDDIM